MKKHIIDIITRILSKTGPIENVAKITHLLFGVPRVGNSFQCHITQILHVYYYFHVWHIITWYVQF